MRINDSGPSPPPSATVRIQEWSAAYYAQAEAGKGTLYYNGRAHRFTISGGGVGGSGAQKVNATGKVYNLNNLSSFPGTYHGISRGLTLIEGKMHVQADQPEWCDHVSRRRNRRPGLLPRSTGISGSVNQLREEAARFARCLSTEITYCALAQGIMCFRAEIHRAHRFSASMLQPYTDVRLRLTYR